jgi:lipopolysaccharide transport system ATP-binding protein
MEGVSKLYRLGQVGTGTLAHDLNRFWARLRGKEDPFSRIGSINDTAAVGDEYVWALQDIDLEVKQGEILGIIGKNGAGKSTLLKLLSRVTSPTKGEIHIKGKIASLLEVGTGFHPELTGLENIYLNGTILGMSRTEIRRKLDEIIDFSGCANYIDTPVKRYSSGMYVRLAFAVAAHLEPDILIVDEVLAVGDAEFQSKCIGKMKDVSQNSGRTVLFVSHNMASIKQLCPQSVLLEKGKIIEIGKSSDLVESYLSTGSNADRFMKWNTEDLPKNDELQLRQIAILDNKGRVDSTLATENEIRVQVDYVVLQEIKNLRLVLTVRGADGSDIFSTSDYLFQDESRRRPVGNYTSTCYIPGGLMTTGNYVATLDFEIPLERQLLGGKSVSFQISELSVNQLGVTMAAKPLGAVHPLLDWVVEREMEIGTR